MHELQFWFTHLVLCEFNSCTVLRLVTQSCLTIFDPTDCSLPVSSVHGDSPSKNTGVGCHALLQETFPAQGSNPGLPHYGWILYHLKHQGSPRILEWVVHPFSRGSFPSRNWTGVSCIPGGFFTSWATREAHVNHSIILILCGSELNKGPPMWGHIVFSRCSCFTPLPHLSRNDPPYPHGTDLSCRSRPVCPVLFCGPSGVWSPLCTTSCLDTGRQFFLGLLWLWGHQWSKEMHWAQICLICPEYEYIWQILSCLLALRG